MKQYIIKFSLLIFIITCLFGQTWAAVNPADLDPSFNTSTPVGFNGNVRTVATQNDGKIIAGGEFTTYQGISAKCIIRLNADGSIDPSFVVDNGFDYPVYSITLQDDGKILVGGAFTSYQGEPVNRIIRLNTDGSIDTSFVVGDGFDDPTNTILIQDDDKLLIGGYFTSYQGEPANKIIRLNPDGSIDASFVVGDGFDGYIYSIALQTDGKIVAGGGFTGYQGSGFNHIIRLTTTGEIDTSFVVGDGFNDPVLSIAIDDQNKIIAVGMFNTYQNNTSAGIIRLNTDGSIDTSFVVGGFAGGIAFDVAIQENGTIFVAGSFTYYNSESIHRIILLNSDGTKDTSFELGEGFDAEIYSISVQNEYIVVGGGFTTYQDKPFSRITSIYIDGSPKTGFYIGKGFDNPIYDVVIQDDGKILVGGDFTTYQGVSKRGIVRLNGDGSIDPDFDIQGGFLNRYPTTSIKDIAIQSNNKIVVGGSFVSYQGEPAKNIIRLNPDGSIDTSFEIGDSFNDYSYVNALVIQEDGKIIVAGAFSTYQGEPANKIIRLNTDGSIDTSFVVGDGFNNNVTSLNLQEDGKIIVGGSFSTYQGEPVNNLIRLNTDGSIDTNFTADSNINSQVTCIVLQNDNKILVGGWFSNNIIRLNPDGSIDTSFEIGDSFNQQVRSLYVQDDGKILVGGHFTTYQGEPVNKLIRLNTDGSIDTTFNAGNGLNSSPSSIVPYSDGRILIGGFFNNYQGRVAGYLMALYGDSEYVLIPDSTNTGIVEQEFTNKGYIRTNGDLDGNTPISLEITDGLIPVNLHLKNDDIKLYVPEGSQFTTTNTLENYNGIISVPVSNNIPSIYDEDVISSFKVGSSSRSLELSGGLATLSVPIEDADVGDMINVYYSEDNGATWYPHGSFMVTSYNGDPYASFTTSHFTDFAITLPEDITLEGSFVINNDEETTISQEVMLSLSTTPESQFIRLSNNGYEWSEREDYTTEKTRYLSTGYGNKIVYAQFDVDGDTVSDIQTNDTINYIQETSEEGTGDEGRRGGGGGGGIGLIKDICPENRDCSNGYYDLICGPCEENIHNAPEDIVCDISGSPYSQELNEAYVWACTQGITSAQHILDAKINEKITRAQVAKMIGRYATHVLNKSINKDNICSFDDIGHLSGQDLYQYTLESCQLNLMGLNPDGTKNKIFNPSRKVNRAQFATLLSRLLYDNTYNLLSGDTSLWYGRHLMALNNAGIITKISSPLTNESRGYIMLMLMRASESQK